VGKRGQRASRRGVILSEWKKKQRVKGKGDQIQNQLSKGGKDVGSICMGTRIAGPMEGKTGPESEGILNFSKATNGRKSRRRVQGSEQGTEWCFWKAKGESAQAIHDGGGKGLAQKVADGLVTGSLVVLCVSGWL